jgi:putative MATE family efflux protein
LAEFYETGGLMKDLTKGQEGSLIFWFAVPMLIGNMFQQLYHVINSVILGQFVGKEALAAIGAAQPIIFSIISFIVGIAIGGTIVIAQYYGARDMVSVKKTVDTLYIFIFAASIVMSIVGVVFSGPLLKLIGTPEDMLQEAKIYMQIFQSGLIFLFGFNATSAILRGLGDSKTPLYFLMFSTLLNILLDLLFIIVFHWGIAGAALATVISQAFAFFATIWFLNRSNRIVKVNFRDMHFDRAIFMQSVRIGLPTGLQQTFVSIGMVALLKIVNSFGTSVVAAYSAAGRIDNLAILPAMNLSMALSTFVGQNIGAGKSERVRAGLRATIRMTVIMSVIMSLIIVILKVPLMKLFTPDAEVIRVGAKYLLIVGSFYLVFNLMFTVGGVMRGAGDTLIPMFITLFSLWVIRVPSAFLLAEKMGETGIWWSIPSGWLVGLVLSYLYYLTGSWKRKSVVRQAAD